MLSFIPIVTTYTVTSDKRPLEALMQNSALLSRAFLEYREKVGYETARYSPDGISGASTGLGYSMQAGRRIEALSNPSNVI